MAVVKNLGQIKKYISFSLGHPSQKFSEKVLVHNNADCLVMSLLKGK